LRGDGSVIDCYNKKMSVITKHYVVVAPLTYTGAASEGFTYEHEGALAIGQVVKVPLGRRQSLGVVTATNVAQPTFATKAVADVLEIAPLPHHLITLATWMAGYYYASPKSIWQTMLPAGITRKRRVAKADPAKKVFTLPKQDQPLTPEQQAAFDAISTAKTTTYLVQGVTGSGKTRLYLELTSAQLAAGRSAIILIPEIALTPQLLALFEASFPGRVIAFHSGLSEAEKHKAWQRTLEATEPLVVVGARSGLFLPLARIGLVVIDECHETSYKQEQNPRYHAIPTAAKLAQLTGATLVLGSATPGLVEVYAAEIGRITLLKLTQRIAGRPLPTAAVVDMRERQIRGANRFLSIPLIAALRETLGQGRQSLLFINRRGSASSQICNHCGTVTLCPRCELPLTFHADELKLICHVCNYRSTPAAVCPVCGQAELRYLGGGTKRIEAEIATLLPQARLARLDRDSADPKLLPQLYEDLHAGRIDILIGTQMVAKGLDLPDLDTVGVINADTILHMPDFSSAERTFQLLAQVAGRSGRGAVPGRVFIQTHTPDHPTIQAAAQGDFWRFAATELDQRRQLGYPPFRFLLKMIFGHAQQATAISQSQAVYDTLKQNPEIKVLGPAPAFHERAGGTYHWQIIAKAARRSALLEVAAALPTTWKTDIDPINVL
jgi:primosomal protein N' (replication factor Y)